MGREQDDAAEAVNREQEDDGQAQDVADDARNPGPVLGESSRAPGGAGDVLPDDTPDLVDTMKAMVTSGHIDNGAFAGEPVHDDEEGMLGDTDEEADDPLVELHEVEEGSAGLFNPLADGSEDPLAVLPDLAPEDADADEVDDVADTGEDPLAGVASDRGDEWGRDPDDLDDDAGEEDEPGGR